jgi:hypothetical protein
MGAPSSAGPPQMTAMKKGRHKGHQGGTKLVLGPRFARTRGNTKALLGALRAPITFFVPFVLGFVLFVLPLFPLLPTRYSLLAMA